MRGSVGGGMRQVGILGAAGLIALETMPHRLSMDHENARMLAAGLAEIAGIRVITPVPATNIVIFDVSGTGKTSAEISAALKLRCVLINGINPATMRAVTHYDVTAGHCAQALTALGEVLS